MVKLVLIFFFICLACTRWGLQKKEEPADVVKHFIEVSSTTKDSTDKLKLQNLCVGELRRAFERMPDEAFSVHYLHNDIKVKDLSILDIKTENEKSHVRYRVTIVNTQGTTPTEEMNEREVELSLSQGAWYIETIKVKGEDKIAFTRGMIF